MPRRIQIPAYLSIDTVDELERLAQEHDKSRNAILREAVEAFLQGPADQLTKLQTQLKDARDCIDTLQEKTPDDAEESTTWDATKGCYV